MCWMMTHDTWLYISFVPNYWDFLVLLLLSTNAEKFSVSCMRDFSCSKQVIPSKSLCYANVTDPRVRLPLWGGFPYSQGLVFSSALGRRHMRLALRCTALTFILLNGTKLNCTDLKEAAQYCTALNCTVCILGYTVHTITPHWTILG